MPTLNINDTPLNDKKEIEKLYKEQLSKHTGKRHVVSNTETLLKASSIAKPLDQILLRPGTYGGGKVFIKKGVLVRPYEENLENNTVVFKNIRLVIEGGSLVGVTYDDQGGTTLANTIRVTSEVSLVFHNVFKNITMAKEVHKFLSVETGANGSKVIYNKALNTYSYLFTLDENDDAEVALDVEFNFNDFENCKGYYFQAGQLGKAGQHGQTSWGEFIGNVVKNSESAELKVSNFYCSHNVFVEVENGFNLRIGSFNTISNNIFVGGKRASRIFGRGHLIENNLVINPEKAVFIYCRGSLEDQFRVLENAHHVLASRVKTIGNTIIAPKQHCFYVGDAQTGMKGTGNRTVKDRKAANYPHYEPYNPSGLEFQGNHLHTVDTPLITFKDNETLPNLNDGYPSILPQYSEYKDMRVGVNFLYKPKQESTDFVTPENYGNIISILREQDISTEIGSGFKENYP